MSASGRSTCCSSSRPSREASDSGCSVARGRPEGTVDRYLWQATTPSVDELQERIAEAVTGVVSLENLLHILAHFGALPERTVVVEVEPESEEGWGPDLSEPARLALELVEALIR